MESLGQKIRRRRLDKKLTQAQLADGLVSASAISQIESDKINPSYKLLCQIADRLEAPLEMFISDRDDYREQLSSHKLAKTLISAKEFAKALPILENLEESGSPVDDLDLWKDLALCHLQMRNYPTAHQLLEQVTHHALKEEQHHAYVWALHHLGRLFFQQNNIALGTHYWQKGYEYLSEYQIEDRFLKARLVTNLAIANNRMGNFATSSELFRKSQEIIEDMSDPELLASNYVGLGKSYYHQGQYATAESYWQEAITLFKTLDNIRYSIVVKENFGIMQGENDDLEGSMQTLQQCIREYREHNMLKYSSNAQAELAKLFLKLGRLAEAAPHVEEAFRFCEPGTVLQGQCYYVRSMWHEAMGEHEQALADGQQAAEIFSKIEAIHEYSDTCLHLSNLFKSVGDYKSSTEILERSQRSMQEYIRERGV